MPRQFPSFKNPGYAILRTFVMMTGEMEFDNYFAPGKFSLQLLFVQSRVVIFGDYTDDFFILHLTE